MFLHLLQTDEEKEAFIQMAFIVAIANVEDSDEESLDEKIERMKRKRKAEFDSKPIRGLLWHYNTLSKGSFSGNKDWKMSAVEKAIIDGFLKELELSSDEVSTGQFNRIIDELTPALSKITRLSEEERRLEIIEKLIEDGIAWDTIEQIDPKSARSMMIELLSVALIDGDYAPLEKVVIESITKKLSIDADEIEEMEAFVRNMNQVYQSGLEIISN